MSHCAIKLRCLAIAAACLVAGIPNLVIPARAAGPDLDPGSKQTGKAPCRNQLWVGGYRGFGQSGNCEPQSSGDPRPRRRRGYTDKPKVEERRREHDRFKQDREDRRLKEKDKAAKDRAARDKKDREIKDKQAREKKCRGLGLPANCDLANPGKAKGRKP